MREELQEFANTILGAMDRMENRIMLRLDDLDRRVSALETRMSTLENKFESLEQRVCALERVFHAFEERVRALEIAFRSLEVVVTDLRDDMSAGLRAVDDHAIRLIEHGKRIGRLEKVHKKLLLKTV